MTMSQPRKKRGFRSITVENQTFQWRFAGIIDVRPEGRKNNQLTVDFGWYDKWLFVNDRDNEPPNFAPKVVTPELVSQAIRYALENGWDADLERGAFAMKFKDGAFSVE